MTTKPVNENASEAYAYSPGLKVKRRETIRKDRRLPLRGDVLVNEGDMVEHDTVIAEVSVPGKPTFIKAAALLNVENDEYEQYLKKKVGDEVKKDEIIAECISLFGLIKKQIISPMDGFLDSSSPSTGRIVVRSPPESVVISAYIPGKITRVTPGEGATVETQAAIVQGILGIGGESHGTLRLVATNEKEELTPDKILPEHRGCILLGGSLVTEAALRRAVEQGVAGIIVGGIREEDLTRFRGEPVGVAITGDEDLGISLMITEGFGRLNMSERTFSLLSSFEGYLAHMNGATQIRAGVLRPEVIIPHSAQTTGDDVADELPGLRPGTPVRIIQTPYFGELGKVVSLPVNLQQVETEANVRVVVIELDNGEVVTVPRANVEVLEI